MRIILWLVILIGFGADGADSFSKKTTLKPVTVKPAPTPMLKPLKPVPLAAPGSTYRPKPEPVFKPQPKFEKLEIKPAPMESELHKIKLKKLEPIDLKIKKAPSPEPSSTENKN